MWSVCCRTAAVLGIEAPMRSRGRGYRHCRAGLATTTVRVAAAVAARAILLPPARSEAGLLCGGFRDGLSSSSPSSRVIQMRNAGPPPTVTVARRFYGAHTHGRMGRNNEAALSLADLAKAFQLMGDETATSASPRVAAVGKDDSTSGVTDGGGPPLSATPSSSASAHLPSSQSPAESSRASREDNSAHPRRYPRGVPGVTTVPETRAADVPASYALHLPTLDNEQLRDELERHAQHMNYAEVGLCLHEATMVRRRRCSSGAACIEASAREDVHRGLLHTVLSVIIRLDLEAVQRVGGLETTTLSIPLPGELTRWLAEAVSHMDAAMSLRMLHLLAQQHLFHHEAILATLVDNITTHLERTAGVSPRLHEMPSSPSSSPSTPSPSAPLPFALKEYSFLFDTIARYHAQVSSMTYRGVMTDAAVEQQQRRQMLEGSHHPVANRRFYHHVAECLTRLLTMSTSCSSGEAATAITTATSPPSLLQLSSKSFLFLTRALGKVEWWHDGLMAALAPQLVAYLRAHPASYFGVVLLVGHSKYQAGDAALLEALQGSLLTLLRRRGKAQGMRRGDDDAGGAVATAPPSPSSSPYWRESESAWLHDDVAESVEISLFSSPSACAFSGSEEDGGVRAVSPDAPLLPPSTAAAAASLTFLDLHSLPIVVESLSRFHARTLVTLPSAGPATRCATAAEQNDVRRRLVTQMRQLFDLLLTDTLHGIGSAEVVAQAVSPALLARVLLTLLAATTQLRQAWATAMMERDEEEEGHHVVLYHTLLIELAYAWTQQIAALRPPPLPPAAALSEKTAAAAARFHRIANSAQWRRAVAVHVALVRAGLLKYTAPSAAVWDHEEEPAKPSTPPPSRYYMPEEVLRAAPRVAIAVRKEMERISAERRLLLQEGIAASPLAASGAVQEEGAPRYASEAVRHRSKPSHRRPPTMSSRQKRALQRPVRVSDVFAKYAKALSRLL